MPSTPLAHTHRTEEVWPQRLFNCVPGTAPVRVAVVTAHPDDEIIGAGAQIGHWHASPCFINITDGAPRDMRDASAAGFTTSAQYSLQRRKELRAALTLAGAGSALAVNLNIPDQRAAFHLAQITNELIPLLRAGKFTVVLTQPYEGGHPDHDSTAFAVHKAVQFLSSGDEPAPLILEMTGYFNRAGAMATAEFLPDPQSPELEIVLDPGEQAFKRTLFDCFSTQANVLRWFRTDRECFRVAPRYDFANPPHEGMLYYEIQEWGVKGTEWRRLASEAAAQLERSYPAAPQKGSAHEAYNP